MIGWGNNTLRGGQTAFHGIHMWAQMFRIALFVAAAMIIAVPVWNIWRNTTGYEWYAAGMYTLVEGKLTIGFKGTSLQEIKDPYGAAHVFSLDYISNWYLGWASREHLRDENLRGRVARCETWRGPHRGILHRVLDPGQPPRAEDGTSAAQNWSRPGNCAAVCSPCILRFLQYRLACSRSFALPCRRRALSGAHRDPAHHRLGYHGFGKNRADRRSGRADSRPRRALRHLRQDGQLYAILLRSRTGCPSEPAR